MTPPRLSKILQNKNLTGVLYFVVCTYVFGIWVWSAETPTTSFNGDPRSTLSDVLYGTAHRPYVQRILIPMVTRSIHDVVPTSAWNSLHQHLLSIPKVQKETARLGWETAYLSEYLIALTLAFCCLFGFCFVVRNLWCTFYKTEETVANMVPIIALLALPPIFPSGPHYIYDFPALLFFTWGLVLLLQFKWEWFYPVFVVGCLNKETTILLSLVFILLNWTRLPLRTVIFHSCIQLILFGTVHALITHAFSTNPGNSLDFHLYLNIHILLSGYGWTTLVVGLIVSSLLLFDLKFKHPALKQSALLIIPFGALLLWGGVITELRDLYELYPIYLILSLHTAFFSILKLPYKLYTIGEL